MDEFDASAALARVEQWLLSSTLATTYSAGVASIFRPRRVDVGWSSFRRIDRLVAVSGRHDPTLASDVACAS